jgi:TetR/AcrR family transcriptional regulator, cholesterol catabolism regulator
VTHRAASEGPTTADKPVPGPGSGGTRARILDAAASVLTRKGYSGTRLSDIADEVGIRTPGIYYYFESRDALIEEVIRVGQHRARAEVEQALSDLPDSSTPAERLVTAVETHLRTVLSLSEYTTAAIRNVGQLPSEMRRELMQEHADYGQVWHALFEAARQDSFPDAAVDLRALRLLVIGALNWAPEWWRPHDSIEETVAAARFLARRLLGQDDQQ